jgi:hypothetical protein
MSGTIDFAEFLQVIDYQKNNAAKGGPEKNEGGLS